MSNTSFMNSNPLRLLLVDDDVETRQKLTLLFQRRGIIIQTVATARQAMQIVSEFKPDMLILNTDLPNEDAYTLLTELRNLLAQQEKLIPAIALSGAITQQEGIMIDDAGFQIQLSKPINLSKLVSAVARLSRYV